MDEESLYPDSDPEEESPDATEEKPESKEKDDDKDDGPTELVSKKFLGLDEDTKAEPGHKCTLEVVHDFGDEVEVRYVKHKKKPKEDREEMSADDELDSIDAKG